MNCLELQDMLQDMMDGAAAPAPSPEAAAHLADCAACRELFGAAQTLGQGLTLLAKPEPSPLLTQSIVASVLAEHRRVHQVRRRIVLAVGLAASILLALLVGWFVQPPAPENKGIVQQAPPQAPEAPKLVQRAEDARTAVASLTERVADQTKEQAKLLMAVADSLDLPTNLPALNGWEEPLDPAAKSLRQATQTVADGVEPITRSARRAFTFFVNEMPMFDIPQRN
jgi:predicted anti-sigma-YlaC factor YlaD